MSIGPAAAKDDHVEVLAEWALKSKEPTDVGYRLLNTSREVLSADNFEAALDRYSPGTMETLPQVTINWLVGKPERLDQPDTVPVGQSYVGIAIHAKPSSVTLDATGREFVETSYYCVDFRSLRERSISYRSMYEGFKDFDLHGRRHGHIKASLGVAQPMPPEYSLVYQAAGLLLANKSVCILGADDASIDQRLRFIDEVASLLPYGMRSRLSASTWTSSTYKRHNFRLFFSSVERNADDFHLVWGESLVSTGLAIPDAYIVWLAQNPERKVRRLAEDRLEMGFGIEQIAAMFVRLGVLRALRAVPVADQTVAPSPSYETPTPPEAADHLLNEISKWLASPHPDAVERFIPQLRLHIRDDLADSDREHYRQIIDQHKLLREDLKINRDLRAELYRTLLRLAYGVPINYVSYCALERSQDNDLKIHEPLAQAIYEVGAHQIVQLLVLGSIGTKWLDDSLRRKELRPKRLVEIITNPNLQVHHRQYLCDVALRYLEERPQRFDPDGLEAAFASVNYLADILFQIYRQDPQYELSMVKRVLQLVHGTNLDRATICKILDNCVSEPTCVFYAALLELAAEGQTEEVVWEGFCTFLMSRGFHPSTQDNLARILAADWPADPEDDIGKDQPTPETGSAGSARW